MLRHPPKPALNMSVEQFQAAGGQIQPAANSGKLTVGQEAIRKRARQRRARHGAYAR